MPTSTRPPRKAARTTLSDELRDAIDRDGRSPHAIARAAGVDPGIVSRFLAGKRSMTTDTLDRLAGALGLHLAAPPRGRGRPRRDAPGAPQGRPEAPGTDVAVDDDPADGGDDAPAA